MNKFFQYSILLTVCVISVITTVNAQGSLPVTKRYPLEFNAKWSAIGLRFQGQDFYVSETPVEDTCNCLPQSLQSRGNSGFLISFYRNTGSRLAYSLDLGFSTGRVGTKPVPTIKSIKDNFTSFRGDLYYHVGPDKQPVSPYLHAGLHAQLGNFYASLPTGAGFRYLSATRPIMLTAEVNYGWGLTNQLRNNLIFALGFYVRLNGGKTSSPVAQSVLIPSAGSDACLDSDFDGVPDGADKCPRLPGSPLNAGCPVCDTDGDGVVDDKDKCPTIPGPVQQQGCPIADTVYIIKEVVAPVAPTPLPVISFLPRSSRLDSQAIASLETVAIQIRNNPASRYTISGYSGPTRIEKQQSSDQVVSVINYLVEKQGISPDRINYKSGLQGASSNTVTIRQAVSGESFEKPQSNLQEKLQY
jgi:hypothetical protein